MAAYYFQRAGEANIEGAEVDMGVPKKWGPLFWCPLYEAAYYF